MAESSRPKIRTSMQMSQASIIALRQTLQQPLPLCSPLSPRSVRHVRILAGVEAKSPKTSSVQQKVVSVLRPGKGGSSVKTLNSTCVANSLDFGDLALEEKYAAQRRRMSEQVGEVKRCKQNLVPSSASPGQPVQASLLFVPFYEPVTAEELDGSGSSDTSQVFRDLALSRKRTLRRTVTHNQAILPPISPSLHSSQPLFSAYVQTTAPVLTSTHDLLRRKGRKQSQRS